MTPSELRSDYDQAQRDARALHQTFRDRADREGRRPLTAAEQDQVQAAIDKANVLKGQLARVSNDQTFLAEFERRSGGLLTGSGLVRGNSIGAQFLNSAAGRWLRENKVRGEKWETPAVELDAPMFATTIGSDPTSGGMGIPPQYLPDITPFPLRPPVVADLLERGETVSNAIVYMKEITTPNASTPVAEGTLKPEAGPTYEQVTDRVIKIAQYIPVTEELLDDWPAFRSYIDTRLMKGVQVTEDDQLLNGNGTFPNMQGLLNRSGLAAPIARVDPMLNADAIAKQFEAIRSTTFLEPSGVIMNPANWLSIQTLHDSMNRYLNGPGPLVSPSAPSLWGVPVAVTPAIAAGTALVVTRSAATVFRRSPGVVMAATNSHQDYFVRNLVAIRAEERLALCVMLPAAFGTVTGLN